MGYEFFKEKIIFPSAPVPGINNDHSLIQHACNHNRFWGSRCVSSHAPTISPKPVFFTAISAHIFRH